MAKTTAAKATPKTTTKTDPKADKVKARKALVAKMKAKVPAKKAGAVVTPPKAAAKTKDGVLEFKAVDTTSEAYVFYVDFIKDALLGKLKKHVGNRQQQAGAQIKRARAALRSLPKEDTLKFIYG